MTILMPINRLLKSLVLLTLFSIPMLMPQALASAGDGPELPPNNPDEAIQRRAQSMLLSLMQNQQPSIAMREEISVRVEFTVDQVIERFRQNLASRPDLANAICRESVRAHIQLRCNMQLTRGTLTGKKRKRSEVETEEDSNRARARELSLAESVALWRHRVDLSDEALEDMIGCPIPELMEYAITTQRVTEKEIALRDQIRNEWLREHGSGQ